jgi:hypothetical protein
MQTKMNALDALVSEVTAFRSWNDMKAAIGGTGREQKYVPTINGGKAHVKLASICRRNGYRVFRGGRLI